MVRVAVVGKILDIVDKPFSRYVEITS
jgi:hypothetical protein